MTDPLSVRLREWRKRLACVMQGHIWGYEIGAGTHEGRCVRCNYDVEDGWQR